ncbi:MAG: ATP-binding protein [Pseudomonadota bacterium]
MMDDDTRDLVRGIHWLIGFRALFAVILFGATALFCSNENFSYSTQPFLSLCWISGSVLLLSAFYFLAMRIWQHYIAIAYVQLIIDTVMVTVLLFITGGFSSIFTFLYILVIISSSMLLLRRGSMVIATFSSLQYGILIDLEYYGFLVPFGQQVDLSSSVHWTHVIYRILIIVAACFAVAVLSGILALQTKRARRELRIMEGHLKRVERMAALGELAAGMAHEIKNPLASLSGSIQLLKEGVEPGSSNYRLMQIVIRETQRLSSLVTEFLLFAKPQIKNAGNIKMDKLILETIDLFRLDPLCTDRIALETEIQGPFWIYMDPGHLKQILWNLLNNAAEAIEGQGRIRVTLQGDRNNRVKLKVMDTGCGISSKDQETVFNPFFTTKATGTGLGLSIVLRLMDTYEGVIDLESQPGKGSVFTLIFKSVVPQQTLDTSS